MSKQPLSQAYKDLLYLIRCAVRQEQVDMTWSFQTPLASLFRLACFHSIEAFLYDTVKQLPLTEKDNSALKDWQVAHDKAFRRYLLFTTERQAILQEFEKAGIWYLPLKGVVLQNDYPKPYYRQMSDNDILFDKDRRYEVKNIMVGRGYKVGHFNHKYDDAYYKEPCYNFEMHVRASVAPEFEAYFEGLTNRLSSKSSFAREMTEQDFYLYLLSHDLKHYQLGGIGLRSLIDLYFCFAKHSKNLDWRAIEQILIDIGVDGFDKKRYDLLSKLFSDDKVLFESVFDDLELAYYCTSGTHGILEHDVENRLYSKNNIFSYYFYKISMRYSVAVNYPILQKHRYLIPFYMIIRIIQGLFRPQNWRELLLVLKKIGKGF